MFPGGEGYYRYGQEGHEVHKIPSQTKQES